jgi:uncharacterized damage-inducible protein DinB
LCLEDQEFLRLNFLHFNDYTVNSKLQKLIDSLEGQRSQLLKTITPLSSEKLNNRIDNGWSINQIIAHLIAAEKLSLAYIQKKVLAINEVDDTGLVEELKMMALKLSQRLPFRFKAPRLVVENTSTSTDIFVLEQEWISVRQQLKGLLEKFSDDQINRKIYKHVRAGKLNIQHMLIFFGEHIIHHQPQIKRLL